MRLHIVDFPADLLAGIVLSGAGEILDYGASVRVRYRVLPGGVPGVLTGTYPGGNSARVFVPKKWAGKHVKIVLMEPVGEEPTD